MYASLTNKVLYRMLQLETHLKRLSMMCVKAD